MNRMMAQQGFSSLLRRSAMSLFAVALLLSCAISVDSSDLYSTVMSRWHGTI